MCKDHDLQHYAIDLRNIAREITCGDAQLAAELLDCCTQDGLAAFVNLYHDCCEHERIERIKGAMKRSHKNRKGRSLAVAGDVINLWDTELADMLPY
jgi:hypothetical protein